MLADIVGMMRKMSDGRTFENTAYKRGHLGQLYQIACVPVASLWLELRLLSSSPDYKVTQTAGNLDLGNPCDLLNPSKLIFRHHKGASTDHTITGHERSGNIRQARFDELNKEVSGALKRSDLPSPVRRRKRPF